MKTTFPLLSLAVILIGIGCQQQPCVKTSSQAMFAGDTVYTIRTYANCTDTLSYHQKQVKSDSSIVSEGAFANSKKDGEWIYNSYVKRVVNYAAGIETHVKEFSKDGILELESVLGKDSLYHQKQFHSNGTVHLEQLLNLEGYLTGNGVVYDSMGRKMAEGSYIPEDILTDTVYIESPFPPHDLEMTVISESGGKHGPWVYYDFEGKVLDTVNFKWGLASWTGEIVGKWKVESTEPIQDNSSMGMLLLVPNTKGYEFTADGRLGAFDASGKTNGWGTYEESPDAQSLYVFDNERKAHEIFIFQLDETQLKFSVGSRIYHLKKA